MLTVEHVNAQGIAKFSDSITNALGGPGIELFRRLVEDNERGRNAPMVDIAATLALQEVFLMVPKLPLQRLKGPERSKNQRAEQRRDRYGKPKRGRCLASNRIAVGKRYKIGSGTIVGVIANKGGLYRSDFCHITTGPDFSLVEMLAKLPRVTLKKFDKNYISGVLLDFQPDRLPERACGRDGGKPRRKHTG